MKKRWQIWWGVIAVTTAIAIQVYAIGEVLEVGIFRIVGFAVLGMMVIASETLTLIHFAEKEKEEE